MTDIRIPDVYGIGRPLQRAIVAIDLPRMMQRNELRDHLRVAARIWRDAADHLADAARQIDEADADLRDRNLRTTETAADPPLPVARRFRRA